MPKKPEFDYKAERHLNELFHKYYESWEQGINKQIIEDLMIVKKYKGELARAFDEVKGQRTTLIGCMQEIIERQEELLAIQKDLINIIMKTYPRAQGRIEGEEVTNHE